MGLKPARVTRDVLMFMINCVRDCKNLFVYTLWNIRDIYTPA